MPDHLLEFCRSVSCSVLVLFMLASSGSWQSDRWRSSEHLDSRELREELLLSRVSSSSQIFSQLTLILILLSGSVRISISLSDSSSSMSEVEGELGGDCGGGCGCGRGCQSLVITLLWSHSQWVTASSWLRMSGCEKCEAAVSSVLMFPSPGQTVNTTLNWPALSERLQPVRLSGLEDRRGCLACLPPRLHWLCLDSRGPPAHIFPS